MDVLLDIAEKLPGADPTKLEALRALHGRIARIKQEQGGL